MSLCLSAFPLRRTIPASCAGRRSVSGAACAKMPHLNLPQDTGFESTEKAYDLKEMHRVVNSLPKEYRVPFAMHVSGFKYREIAEKLNLPLGTIKSRIFFTRQKLQEELKDFR